MANDSEVSVRRRAVMWIERRVVNPLVERILRSPAHRLLSWRLALLGYEGRVSGNVLTSSPA